MPTWVIMPKLGINMTEGVIVNWLVKEGQAVEKGQPIVEIETDKATQEVEAPDNGVLAKIVAQPGQTLPCTYVIAALTQPGESVPEEIPLLDEAGFVPEASVGVMVEKARAEAASQENDGRGERILVSPAARKLAAELGVDYRSIKGAGGRGRIERADVLAAADVMKRGPLEIVAASSAPLSAATPTTDRIVPMTSVRTRIAERMSQSAQSTARVTLIAEADATQLVGWREQLRRDFPQQAGAIGYNELFVVIAANALRAFPYMNATLRENGIHLLNEINVAVAVDTERGLLAPVVRQADQKSAIQIHQEFARLAELTRSGRIGPDDLSGSTFTITNLGMYEIDTFTPLINLPELAILGVGQVAARPVAVDDRVVVQKRVALSLSFDHRLVDGAPAARFLQRIKHLVEAPYALIPG